MEYTFSLDHKNKIIRYKHSGKLKMEDLGKAWDDFLKIEEFTLGGYNLLSDYTEAIFDMGVEAVDEIVKILDSMGPVLHGKKQSIIVEDPYSMAGSILFEKISHNKLAFKIKIFSTEEAALKFLLS
jgi:hypothetical protein